MPQLSLYLDEYAMNDLRADSAAARLSLSKYVSTLIRDRKTSGAWPQGYWDIYGALNDDSFLAPEDADISSDPIFAL